MVWHYHVRVHPHVLEMIRNVLPTLAGYGAEWTQNHLLAADPAEQMSQCADGNEVRARSRVVVSTQAHRPTVHADARMPRPVHCDDRSSGTRTRIPDSLRSPAIFLRHGVLVGAQHAAPLPPNNHPQENGWASQGNGYSRSRPAATIVTMDRAWHPRVS